MGEVYRARDSRLGRDVAIKVLPSNVTADRDRLARFEREAQVLASLNHPNIAHIHGIDDSSGAPALVMELVEGPTLADRIAKGPIPLDETLPIAKQIAEALEAAHEQGIIHRDLKPANIKVRPDGAVKVLDFGLAKAFEPAAVGIGNATMSPTLSIHATHAGIILGTAAYMAPEQARGKPVDRRVDIWAFGCVVYEMLTGRQAFEGGDTVSDAIAAVLKSDLDLSALPSSVPAQIRLLLKRCLEKDRRGRIGDMGTVRFLLSDTLGDAIVAAVPKRPPFRHTALIGVGGLLVGALLAGGSALWWYRANPTRAPEPIRFELLVPLFGRNVRGALGGTRHIAISPDGRSVAFISGTGGLANQLIVRHLNQLETAAVVTSAAPVGPFFSPDGKWIGYFSAWDGELRKVPVAGGQPVTICRIPFQPRGGTWGPDHTIVFGLVDAAEGLRSVPDGGGEVQTLTRPDTKAGELFHAQPSFLPDGRTVLFTIVMKDAGVENAQIAALTLGTGQRKILVRGGASPQYVSTGYLLYATASGDVRAVRFDRTRLEILTEPLQVVSHVMSVTGGSQFALSQTGTLIYVPGESVSLPTGTRSIVWVDRSGR